MRYLIPLSAFLTLTACIPMSQFQRMTSGSIGCPVNEIVITETDSLGSEKAWTATCRGKTFYCSYGISKNMVCTPEIPKGN